MTLLLALAGGLGAVARVALDLAVRARTGAGWPLGTLLINVTGSFALGLLIGAADRGLVDDAVVTVLGTGFLGGYTTFSTVSVETVRLVQQRRARAAVLTALGGLLVCLLAAAAGLALAGPVSR